MHSRNTKLFAVILYALLLAIPVAAFYDYDDEFPEVEATVARIKFLDGKAEVRRVDSEEWESAVMNLPLVEGDEIRTGRDTRLEIQFDNETYLRLDENSAIKLVSLGDEGAAVSLSEGKLLVSVYEFDPSQGYFEIDAPRTTVAIAEAGKYRVDAGNEYDRTVKVAVWDGGTARVYSLDSGFTLKNDQSASMELEGSYAGRWSVARNSGYRDAFDDWSESRDEYIIESLKDAHYGDIYDDGLYGADDLNDYGSWQRHDDYGYLWSPYGSSISMYSNWSPYRYGTWRWLPYYGWTWVNDEPWGWATYHYGRWIYLGGRWYWTPYGYNPYYRRTSWWRPAIVYLGTYGGRICWYPLPYNYSYYDYNRRYRRYWRDHRRNRNTNQPVNQPTTPDPLNVARAQRNQLPPLQRVPANAVVSTSKEEFGRGKGRFDTAPPTISREILSKKPVVNDSPPLIPSRSEILGKKSPDIVISERKSPVQNGTARIGAANRTAGQSLDAKLKQQKIYGNRPPLTTVPRVTTPEPGSKTEPRTGVFDRTGNGQKENTDRKVVVPPLNRTNAPETKVERKSPPAKSEPTPPVYRPTPRPTPVERKPSPPLNNPAPRRTETRRPDPPARTPPPRTETRKPSPPPAKKPSPPPAKSPPVKNNQRRESKPPAKPPANEKSGN
ncbi:MAG: FecR domain-containing protein [Acidobacteriota bacterium]|nr:MAG: FecR domain-containing protein [Acidobacteriota bacterium]